MNALRRQLRSPQRGALFATMLSLLLLLPLWFWVQAWYQDGLIKQARAKAAVQIAARANALTSAVNQRIALLQGLYAFTRTEWPGTNFDQPFEVYSSGIYFNSTGVRTLMIAPEGIARYIFPLYDSRTLSGYDILNDPDPTIRADVQRAIHTREITLSQPRTLRQGGFGLIAWRAIYRGADLWGLVSIALDMKTVLADSGLEDHAGGLELGLRNGVGKTFFGPDALWQHDPVTQKILLPEGAWELGGAPQNGWNAAVRTQEIFFQISSLLIIVLITGVVYLTVNRQGQLSQAVETRTRQIAAAQQQLEQRVEERTRELSTLLNVSHRISSTLELDPLFTQVLSEIQTVLDYTAAQIFQRGENDDLILVSQTGSTASRAAAQPLSLIDQGAMHQALASLQPVIVPDWSAPGAEGPTACWMGIPLVIKDRAIGMFVFVHQNPQFYQAAHARLALAFAQQVAVAIENARLYEQAGQLAVLQERQRLARELHDSVSQVLYSIGLGAKSARAALDRDPRQIAEALDYVNWLAEAGQVEMRALIFELRPESLRNDGLVVALEKQAAVLRTRHQITVQTDFCPEPSIPLEIKETVYRVSQEATHNIVKHARATQVTMTLICSPEQLCLQIIDNGIGFDPSAEFPGHLGLHSMHERATQHQGTVEINSQPGAGTAIQFSIPLAPLPSPRTSFTL